MELTAERFVPHPYSQERGARLYKTGDLARWRADRDIEYLGRIDQQVKVRDYRIELGEIETLLQQHPAVQDCAASVYEDELNNKRLVAYIVLHQEMEAVPSQSELRRFLQEKLPGYMIPAAFVQIKALPLTSSGKLDRHALPAPGLIRVGPDAAYVAPRTPIEETLADIWRQALNVEQVGIYDDFFALGGYSLLAAQVALHIYSIFQVELPLQQFFRAPTISALASIIEQERGHGNPAG